MSNFGIPQHWFELAEYDIQTARAMLETKRYLYVGFMCHMAVEKALKGVFVSRYSEAALPYIHKLTRLANLSGVYEQMTKEQADFLDALAPLNVESRYPREKEALLEKLTPDYCHIIIQRTEALCQWLMSGF